MCVFPAPPLGLWKETTPNSNKPWSNWSTKPFKILFMIAQYFQLPCGKLTQQWKINRLKKYQSCISYWTWLYPIAMWVLPCSSSWVRYQTGFSKQRKIYSPIQTWKGTMAIASPLPLVLVYHVFPYKSPPFGVAPSILSPLRVRDLGKCCDLLGGDVYDKLYKPWRFSHRTTGTFTDPWMVDFDGK